LSNGKGSVRRELERSLLAKVGLLLVVTVLVVAVFAPLLAPYDPTAQALSESNLPPYGLSHTQTSTELVDGEFISVEETTHGTSDHLLGTDQNGRDMLSRLIYGTRTSILVGVLGTTLAGTAGITVGLVAGYMGGRADDALMRVADVMLAFPSLVLALALIGLIGPAAIQIPDPFVALGLADGMPDAIVLPGTVTSVVGLVLWVWFARITRAEVLAVKQQPYVKAARSLGNSHPAIVWKHVLSNVLTPILVLGTVQVATVILIESSLSFLGFSGTNLSWGFDIARGRDFLSSYWWIATFPGLAIMGTVIGINLVGDWHRAALDPEIQGEGGGGGA
jgi:peptide/nickel transport system permease protein